MPFWSGWAIQQWPLCLRMLPDVCAKSFISRRLQPSWAGYILRISWATCVLKSRV